MYTNILFFTTTLVIIVLGNVQKHEIITVIHVPTGQVSASTFHLSMLETVYCKLVLCKVMSDESLWSTLHRGGEGQNANRMNFCNPCD